MPLLISTMHPFHCNARDNLSHSEVKAEKRERRLPLKVSHSKDPVPSTLTRKRLLGEKFITDIRQKKGSPKAKSSHLTEKIKMIGLNDLEQELNLRKEDARIDENVTGSGSRRTKNKTTEVTPKPQDDREKYH